jgi:hypothetical protein
MSLNSRLSQRAASYVDKSFALPGQIFIRGDTECYML